MKKMETLTTGMLNIRLAQFFSDRRTPNRDDLARLQEGLNFIKRSIAGVRYLEEGESEGLAEDSLMNARYARRTLKQETKSLKELGTHPRSALESIAAFLTSVLQDPEQNIGVRDRKRLEGFFASIGETMVAEAIDSDTDQDDWNMDTNVECVL